MVFNYEFFGLSPTVSIEQPARAPCSSNNKDFLLENVPSCSSILGVCLLINCLYVIFFSSISI